MANEAQQGLKDRDLQKYYEAMLELFSTPGWNYLQEDLTRLLDEGNTLNGIESMEDLHVRRGTVHILKYMLAQPVVVRAAYDTLLAEDNE